jgi:uncharacterized protein
MKQIFVDTFYWVALIHPADQWSDGVLAFAKAAPTDWQYVTTDEVLAEVLTFYGNSGRYLRQKTTGFIHSILQDATIRVIEQTHGSFMAGLELYEQRLDKGYSLTDCISMQTMKQNQISEVLTRDRHFAQEGFVLLLNRGA